MFPNDFLIFHYRVSQFPIVFEGAGGPNGCVSKYPHCFSMISEYFIGLLNFRMFLKVQVEQNVAFPNIPNVPQ
jgi:hypothetical protein